MGEQVPRLPRLGNVCSRSSTSGNLHGHLDEGAPAPAGCENFAASSATLPVLDASTSEADFAGTVLQPDQGFVVIVVGEVARRVDVSDAELRLMPDFFGDPFVGDVLR